MCRCIFVLAWLHLLLVRRLDVVVVVRRCFSVQEKCRPRWSIFIIQQCGWWLVRDCTAVGSASGIASGNGTGTAPLRTFIAIVTVVVALVVVVVEIMLHCAYVVAAAALSICFFDLFLCGEKRKQQENEKECKMKAARPGAPLQYPVCISILFCSWGFRVSRFSSLGVEIVSICHAWHIVGYLCHVRGAAATHSGRPDTLDVSLTFPWTPNK